MSVRSESRDAAASVARGLHLRISAFLVVRAVVEQSLRQNFDHWYSSDHLPRDLSAFKAAKAWRFRSAADAGVHYAVYQFTDMSKLGAAMKDDALKVLIADFDKTWPTGVTRTRDYLNLVEERSAQPSVGSRLILGRATGAMSPHG